MGNITVGQKKQKTVNMGGVTIVPNSGANVENKSGMTAEEKAKKVEEIMQLPKEQIVPELRKHGFNEVADITEAQMKKYQEEKAHDDARKKRLAEIMVLPVEEQLPLLLAEGYEDEAKELSERLAAEQQEQTGDGTGEENNGDEAPADGTTTELKDNGAGDGTESAEAHDNTTAEEPEKKKVGRPKKSEE